MASPLAETCLANGGFLAEDNGTDSNDEPDDEDNFEIEIADQ